MIYDQISTDLTFEIINKYPKSIKCRSRLRHILKWSLLRIKKMISSRNTEKKMSIDQEAQRNFLEQIYYPKRWQT